jgi:outer membrane receptor protein involved in Fe transport
VKNIDLILNYSKRINRPSAETLNPFTSYADPYNLRRGNPEVSPEFIDSYELGLGIIKNKFSLNASVFYKNTINVLQRYRKYYDNGYAAVTYINIDRSESIGSEISINFRPIPSFKNVFSFSGNQIKYHDNEVVFKNNSGFNWSVKYIGTFEFWNKTASIQINTKYNAPIVTMQGTVQPRASLDLSSEKLIKDGKWSFGVKISDIFNSQEFRIHVDQETVNQTSTFKQTTRRLYVNINYKFGKMEVSKKGKITNDANSGGGDF